MGKPQSHGAKQVLRLGILPKAGVGGSVEDRAKLYLWLTYVWMGEAKVYNPHILWDLLRAMSDTLQPLAKNGVSS